MQLNTFQSQALPAPLFTSDNLHLSEPKTTLEKQVQGYVKESVAENTRRAYRADLEHFQQWGGTLPASVEIICAYLVAHAASHKPKTLQRKLVSLSKAHRLAGYPNPVQEEIVQLTMKGIMRTHTASTKQAKPLLKEDILLILAGMGHRLIDHRDKTLLLIGFCGAFRRSELVGLTINDLEWVREGVIIHLRSSKTDQNGEGRKVAIPYGRGRICPCASLQNWLNTSGIVEGLLFRSISKGGELGEQLSDRSVASIICKRAKAVSIDTTNLSGHSLRAGLATSAAQHDISSHKIRQQTGHTSDTMLQRYIRDGELFVNCAGGLF